jgi:hypothetical protein
LVWARGEGASILGTLSWAHYSDTQWWGHLWVVVGVGQAGEASAGTAASLVREAAALIRLQHPNVVRVYGFCSQVCTLCAACACVCCCADRL